MTRTEQDLRNVYAVHEPLDDAEARLGRFVRTLAADGRPAPRQRHLVLAAAVCAVLAAVALSVVTARQLGREADERPGERPRDSVELVPAPATPRSAPFSIGLLPRGWRYLKATDSHVYFSGPDRPSSSRYLGIAGNLAVTLQYDRSVGSFPSTVAGRPARIVRDSQTDAPILEIDQGDQVVVTVQVPESLRTLTDTQLRRMGATIRTRSPGPPEGN